MNPSNEARYDKPSIFLPPVSTPGLLCTLRSQENFFKFRKKDLEPPSKNKIKQNKSPTLDGDHFLLSLDSEKIVPLARYQCGWGHPIHTGVLGSLAQSLGFHQYPHSRMAPMCSWSHRYTIVMLHYGFPRMGEEKGGALPTFQRVQNTAVRILPQ